MADPRMIFVNLPVADLARSRRFLEALGAVNEPRFTDDTAACMTLSESIHVMLLTRDKFAGFTPRPIADAKSATEVLLALSIPSRAQVDSTVEAAVATGGQADPAAKQDFGVMYSRSVADPDGHIWELVWMDPAAAEQGASAPTPSSPLSATCRGSPPDWCATCESAGRSRRSAATIG